MIITVYATRDDSRVEKLAVLGYGVKWTYSPHENSIPIALHVADGARVYPDENDRVMIDEGNNPGVLITYDGKPTLTINTYYGDVNKWLRIAAIN